MCRVFPRRDRNRMRRPEPPICDPDPGTRIRMPSSPTANSNDRRRSPRAQCRLHGRIARGRERIRVRIVDVSEGGLCLLSPIWLDPKKPVQIAIDVPGRGIATVRVEVWHIRREKSRVSTNKVWTAGAILVDSDGTYASAPRGGRPRGTRRTHVDDPRGRREARAREGGHRRRRSTPPTRESSASAARRRAARAPRMLSIAAESEAEALELARRDLGTEWDVLEALEA